MLYPLKQFRCNYCAEIINDPSQGWVEWLDLDGKCEQFQIVHRKEYSLELRGCCGAEGRKDFPYDFIDLARNYKGAEWLATEGKCFIKNVIPGGEYPTEGYEKLGTENMKNWRAFPLDNYIGFKSLILLGRILLTGGYCPGSYTMPEGLDLQKLTHLICRLNIPNYEDVSRWFSLVLWEIGLLPLRIKYLFWGRDEEDF